MIFENEMIMNGVYDRTSVWSYCVKSGIVVSTVVLLALILRFHQAQLLLSHLYGLSTNNPLRSFQLFVCDTGANREDWRIGLTSHRFCWISIELAVFSICPIPGDIYFTWTTINSDGETTTTTHVPLDVLLSLPMFARCLLYCRTFQLHSPILSFSSRSIGSFNRVTVDQIFALKTLMTLHSGRALLGFMAFYWLLASWMLRVCERNLLMDIDYKLKQFKDQSFSNCLWIVAITFLAVGYGDIVPNTHCGRAVSVITGIMGVSTSSLIVAVLAQKLVLTPAEKHVHNFMMDTQIQKMMRDAAAGVLCCTWQLHREQMRIAQKHRPSEQRRMLAYQRKFLMAVYRFREVKRAQSKVTEASLTVSDVAKMAASTRNAVVSLTARQSEIDEQVDRLEQRVHDIQQGLGRLLELVVFDKMEDMSTNSDSSQHCQT